MQTITPQNDCFLRVMTLSLLSGFLFLWNTQCVISGTKGSVNQNHDNNKIVFDDIMKNLGMVKVVFIVKQLVLQMKMIHHHRGDDSSDFIRSEQYMTCR